MVTSHAGGAATNKRDIEHKCFCLIYNLYYTINKRINLKIYDIKQSTSPAIFPSICSLQRAFVIFHLIYEYNHHQPQIVTSFYTKKKQT